VVGQALWGVRPAHFIDQLQEFLEALGQSDLGAALGALTSAVGAGLAVVALGLGAVASWWVGDLAPGLESKRWVVYGLAALALVVGTLLPATAPVLLPLAVGLVRVMAVADLATLAAPAVGNLANGLATGFSSTATAWRPSRRPPPRPRAGATRPGPSWAPTLPATPHLARPSTCSGSSAGVPPTTCSTGCGAGSTCPAPRPGPARTPRRRPPPPTQPVPPTSTRGGYGTCSTISTTPPPATTLLTTWPTSSA
jgi:hypothetical protein